MKHEVLMESYFQEKEVSKRSEILTQLLLDIPVNAKDFFLKGFQKRTLLGYEIESS